MTVRASDANTERVFSKGFAGTSWNGTRRLSPRLPAEGGSVAPRSSLPRHSLARGVAQRDLCAPCASPGSRDSSASSPHASRRAFVPNPNASLSQSVTALLPFIHIIILLTIISFLPHPPFEAIFVASPLLPKRRVPLATAQRAAVNPPRSRKLLFCLRAFLPSAARSRASQPFGRIFPAFIGGMHVQ
jgi:hypothetical protein